MRGKNATYRSREYLTEGEIEKLLTAEEFDGPRLATTRGQDSP